MCYNHTAAGAFPPAQEPVIEPTVTVDGPSAGAASPSDALPACDAGLIESRTAPDVGDAGVMPDGASIADDNDSAAVEAGIVLLDDAMYTR